MGEVNQARDYDVNVLPAGHVHRHRLHVVAYLVAVVVGLSACTQQPQHAFLSPLERPQHRLYFPYAGEVSASADADCFHNPKALAFYRLLVSDPRQQRPVLHCNAALVAAAQKRANGLATVDPWSHADHDGVWPNSYARAAGCKLPSGYGSGNQIESLTAGLGETALAYWSLTNDQAPDHRRHLHGEIEFFRQQEDVGIAVAEGGKYGVYWVVMLAKCEE